MKLKELLLKLKKFIQSIDLSGVRLGTIIRLIMMVISCGLYIAAMLGIEIPIVDENIIANVVLTIFGIISFLQSYWKNNSWTTAAQDADKLMQEKKLESIE